MAKEKAPAFQFYVSDYLTSERTRAMTNDARGVYVDMLAFSWKEIGLPAKLPVLARVIGQPESTLRKLWPQIRGAWKKQGNRIYNQRQEEQREEAHAHFVAQSGRGKKGAAARWGKHAASNGVSIPEAMLPDGSSSSSSNSVEPPTPLKGVSRKRQRRNLREVPKANPEAEAQAIETRRRRAEMSDRGMSDVEIEAQLEREYQARKQAAS